MASSPARVEDAMTPPAGVLRDGRSGAERLECARDAACTFVAGALVAHELKRSPATPVALRRPDRAKSSPRLRAAACRDRSPAGGDLFGRDGGGVLAAAGLLDAEAVGERRGVAVVDDALVAPQHVG